MSRGQRLNQAVHKELDDLLLHQVLNAKQTESLKQRYPQTTWNVVVLVRSFSVLGVLTAVAGLLVILREHLNWWLMGELGLAALVGGFLALAHWVRQKKAMPMTADALELAAAVALQGLTVVLAMHHSTGSKNWPALIGVDAALLLGMAYALANRLVLWYACANLFFFFGAESGYVSGWGAYYLGMSYPARYFGLGLLTLLLAYAHMQYVRGRWAPFGRVYLHYGLLMLNLSLWFMSLFGYYEDYKISWSDTLGQRLGFSLVWGLLAGACIWFSMSINLKLLRSYGWTFLLINLYTFYFQFIAANSAELYFFHLLFAGGSLLWLGMHIDKKRKQAVLSPTPD